MTDQWTPTTDQVRSHYVFNQSDKWDPERGEAFDRWLAAHDAELLASARQDDWEYGIRPADDDVPLGISTMPTFKAAQTRANNIRGGWVIVRRHPATEWEPVPDTEGSK